MLRGDIVPPEKVNHAWVEKAIAYMRAHLGSPLSWGKLADVAGCTKPQLSAAFLRHANAPPMTYLRHLRIQALEARLLQGEPVGRAARAVGYKDSGALAGAWSKHHAESPNEWRYRRLAEIAGMRKPL
jgi:transcriptional regulator GlxA family with amidase domain